MAKISPITVFMLPDRHTITIRKNIDFMSEFSDFFGDCLKKINEYLEDENETVASAPMVCFHNTDLAQLDVEAGYHVYKALEGTGEIKPGLIPAGKVVCAIDQGPYEQQDPTLEELMSWVQRSGRTMTGGIYYYYLSDTLRPESEYLTQMEIPIS